MYQKILDFLTTRVKNIPVYVIIIGVLALLVVAYFVFFRSNSSCPESFTTLTKPVNFMMFYTDWCPHCQVAKPEFQKVMDRLGDGKLNGHSIEVKMINAEKDKELAKQFNVEGYPTIILTKDDKNYTYEGNRTEKDMMSYLETMLRY
jgi:thiol-disulfide isomerase/thioredoxin